MKVARTVWTYTKTKRLVRDGEPVLLTATAGDAEVVIEETTVTVTVPFESKDLAIGAVLATFDKDVTINEVLVGDNNYTTAFVNKFGNDKAKFEGTVDNLTWADLEVYGPTATVKVTADDVEQTFTINFVIAPEVTYTVAQIQADAVVNIEIPGEYMISISKANMLAKFPNADNDTVFEITFDDEVIELVYAVDSDGNEIWLSSKVLAGEKSAIEACIVTIKPQ